jgi:hypothetical protein
MDRVRERFPHAGWHIAEMTRRLTGTSYEPLTRVLARFVIHDTLSAAV